MIILLFSGGPEFGKTSLYDTCTLPFQQTPGLGSIYSTLKIYWKCNKNYQVLLTKSPTMLKSVIETTKFLDQKPSIAEKFYSK